MAADNAAPSPNPSPHTDSNFQLVFMTALIVVAVVSLFLLHVLGSLRRRTSDKLLHAVVLGAYTLSYALVSYTLGLMQESTDYFAEFPVWAVCLLMLLGGTDNLMACKLDDVQLEELPREAPLKGDAGGVHRCGLHQRCPGIQMASKSNLLAKSVKPIVDYMKGWGNHQISSAATMEGCRYVVAGEHRLGNCGQQPKHDMKITTVEQIWDSKSEGSLLRSESERGMRLKDGCLSMALSKMLNRRFAGFKIAEAELVNDRDYFFNRLLVPGNRDKLCERMFRVTEVRHLALCLPVAMVIFCSWLTSVIFKKHHEEADSVPLCTTLYLMSVVTFLEAFQLYLHVASDWFKVALIRSYVTRPALRGSVIWSMIISLALRLKAFRPWESNLGQYCLLQNYDGTRRTSNFIHYVTLWLVDRAKKGCKRGELVKLSTHAKKAVIDSLGRSKGRLKCGTRSPEENGVQDKLLPWVWDTSAEMVTQTILVWHIATTICKHEFGAALPKHGKQLMAVLPEEKENVPSKGKEEDDDAVFTASSLSQYCAYLIAFAPDLLPAHTFDSASILEKCIEDARKFKPLKDAKTIEKKCEMLMRNIDTDNNTTDSKDPTLVSNATDSKDPPITSDTDNKVPPPPIVIQLGAQLATQLKSMDVQKRWKVLSEFWAEMMLYISPCDDAKARAHLEALARGGEFITHLWALLNHAGMLEREKTGVLKPDLVGLEAV
ncbi:unnamed protein product [Alopecurus aequalis]